MGVVGIHEAMILRRASGAGEGAPLSFDSAEPRGNVEDSLHECLEEESASLLGFGFSLVQRLDGPLEAVGSLFQLSEGWIHVGGS